MVAFFISWWQRFCNSREYTSGLSARITRWLWSQNKCKIDAELSAARWIKLVSELSEHLPVIYSLIYISHLDGTQSCFLRFIPGEQPLVLSTFFSWIWIRFRVQNTDTRFGCWNRIRIKAKLPIRNLACWPKLDNSNLIRLTPSYLEDTMELAYLKVIYKD